MTFLFILEDASRWRLWRYDRECHIVLGRRCNLLFFSLFLSLCSFLSPPPPPTPPSWPLHLSSSSLGNRLLSLRRMLRAKKEREARLLTLHLQPWWSGVTELCYLPISSLGLHSATTEWKRWLVRMQKREREREKKRKAGRRLANVRRSHSVKQSQWRPFEGLTAPNLVLTSRDRFKETCMVEFQCSELTGVRL